MLISLLMKILKLPIFLQNNFQESNCKQTVVNTHLSNDSPSHCINTFTFHSTLNLILTLSERHSYIQESTRTLFYVQT